MLDLMGTSPESAIPEEELGQNSMSESKSTSLPQDRDVRDLSSVSASQLTTPGDFTRIS